MATMTKRERVQAALHGADVDRLPLFFWHHFRPRGSARALADATLDFFGGYDLDIYKIMPDLPYPFPRESIRRPDDWHLLVPVAPTAGTFGRVVETVRRVRREAGPATPLVVTIFSPLTEALRFAGVERLREHVRDEPATVHGALGLITANLRGLCTAVLEGGADGLYVAVQGLGDGLFTPAEYAEFGRPYDMQVLESCREGWLTIVHVHGERDLRIEDALSYPAAAFSWSDRLTGIPLRRAWEAVPTAAVVGGINERGAIYQGPPEQVTAEMRDAVEQTGGRRLILAPGCSVPDDCPDAGLRAARAAVEGLASPAS